MLLLLSSPAFQNGEWRATRLAQEGRCSYHGGPQGLLLDPGHEQQRLLLRLSHSEPSPTPSPHPPPPYCGELGGRGCSGRGLDRLRDVFHLSWPVTRVSSFRESGAFLSWGRPVAPPLSLAVCLKLHLLPTLPPGPLLPCSILVGGRGSSSCSRDLPTMGWAHSSPERSSGLEAFPSSHSHHSCC